MTDLAKKVQELEQTVAHLKIRAFDATEAATHHSGIAEGFKEAIVKIAHLVGLGNREDVTTDHVVEAVKTLSETQPETQPESKPVEEAEVKE